MSFEPETAVCPSCKRRGCWDRERWIEGNIFKGYDYICKCGYSIDEEFKDWIELGNCPHGETENGECPEC